MAAHKALRRFPWNLAVGTDVCHVVRIRSILESARGPRFIRRILNADERRHPKIQPFLDKQTTPDLVSNQSHDMPLHQAVNSRKSATDVPDLSAAPPHHDLQVAAAFMAGRYVRLSGWLFLWP